MPVMDGFTFRQKQRQDRRFSNIPVVLVSTIATEHVSELEPAGALDKPIDVYCVIELLRRLSPQGRVRPVKGCIRSVHAPRLYPIG